MHALGSTHYKEVELVGVGVCMLSIVTIDRCVRFAICDLVSIRNQGSRIKGITSHDVIWHPFLVTGTMLARCHTTHDRAATMRCITAHRLDSGFIVCEIL